MRLSARLLMPVGLLTLAGILYFGLTPKGFDRTNNVTVLRDEPGLRFSPVGVAVIDPVPVPGEDFALELIFRPSRPPAPGFSIMAMFHAGSDASQLIVGQWQSQIVVMNGDDYDHSRRKPRVTFDTAELDAGNITLTVATKRGRSDVRVNGELLQPREGLVFRLPSDDKGMTRLFLGNGITLHQPWDGVLSGAVLDVAGTSPESPDSWTRVLVLDAAALAATAAGGDGVLAIPERIPMFEHRVLGAGFDGWNQRRGLALDVLVNLLGFVPFGVVGVVIALQVFGSGRMRGVLLVVLCGCVLSLVMEVAQAWLPARDSSLLDLGLNTLGTAAGAIAGSLALRRLRSRS